jgi:hypothetical protein
MRTRDVVEDQEKDFKLLSAELNSPHNSNQFDVRKLDATIKSDHSSS